jgi:two-component system response regulator FixJ
MELPLALHVVDSDSRSRAEQARTAFALGHHAEVYADLAELFARMPTSGILLLRERAMDISVGELFDRFGELGVWVPLIVCAENPQIEHVVDAIKDGALDYLQLPLEAGRLARSLARVAAEAEEQGLARRRLSEARRRIGLLSKREREVLELLSLGFSNKLIARQLTISPRTVEIHRSNMMLKLRAGHPAEAVRLWLESELEARIPDPRPEYELEAGRGLSLSSDFARMLWGRAAAGVEGEGGRSGHGAKDGPRRARTG